jgi:N-acetyl-1-D-myo-inositol-2-amino-2-deoxy-alpha-D-glucopyranoside deacetylase
MERSREAFQAAGIDFFGGDEPEDGTPWACADEWITTVVRDDSLEPVKVEALLAHATQITPDSVFLQISGLIGPEALGTEHFRLVHGVAALGPEGVETDVFAGLDLDAG